MTNNNKNFKNFEKCLKVAEEFEKYASGEYFLYEEELLPIAPEEFATLEGCEYIEDTETYLFGGEDISDCVEAVGITDWLDEEVLDIEYTFNSRKELLGVACVVAIGGPHIEVDTRHNRVNMYWGGEECHCEVNPEACEELNECLEELF